MKKIARICGIVLCALLLASASSLCAAAEDGGIAAGEGVVFEYTSGGVKKYADSTVDFGTVVAQADQGSTVYMHSDYTVESSQNGPIATVNRKLTLDMQGHTFTLKDKYESSKNNGQISIYVSTADGFTVKNGTVISGFSTSAQKERAYPFFHFGANGAVLNLENVNSYVGPIIYSWGTSNVKLNITGGEHHSVRVGSGCDGGFIDSRAGITASVRDAKIFISDNSWLVSSLHQNDKTGAPVSTFTFENCDVITESADINLIPYASEYTRIYFNGTRLFGGTVTPGENSGDRDKGIGVIADGGILLGEGTAWHTGFNYDAKCAIADGYVLYNKEASKSISLSRFSGNLCDGYSIAAAASSSYTTAYNVFDPASVPKVTVYWRDEGGELLATTEAPENASATPPTLESYREVAGEWYTQVYDGWSRTPGGAPDNKLIATDGVSFYVTRGSVKPNFTHTKYNLKLMGHVQLTLFVPEFLPSNVSVVGVYRSEAEANAGTGAVSKGKLTVGSDGAYGEYIVGWSGATRLYETKSIYVKYTVKHDGRTSTLVQQIKLSALGYLKALLADSERATPSYPRAAHKMVANILRYSYVLTETVGLSQNSEIAALYGKYVPALLDEIDNSTDTDFPESTLDVGELRNYVQSIAFEVGSYQPRYRIVFKKDSGVTDMKIGFEGWFAGSAGEPNWKEQTFSYNKTSGILYYDSLGQYVNTSGKVCDVEGNVLEGKSAGTVSSNIAVLYSDNIQIYNINMDMTVTLTTSGGTVSGQYGINTYYNGIKETLDTQTLTSVRKFLKVMRAYGESVVAYRFVGGRDPVGEDVDKTVRYKDFGATGDGVTNDFEAIRRTHEYANSMGYSVAAESGATYYIGTTGGKSAVIKTDTDWSGATFYIDDTCFEVTNTTERNASIFKIMPETSTVSYTASSSGSVGEAIKAINAAGGIDKNNFTRLDLGLGYPALVHLINDNHKCYIRYGVNENAGSSQRELVLIDKDGYVDASTPLLFDYSELTSVQVSRIDDTPITVKGGEIITNANAAPREYTYYARNILVQRSNVTVTGVSHRIVGEGDTGAPYNGFFTFSGCHNSTLRDSVLSAHKAYKLSSNASNTMGTYDLSFSNANSISCYNVTMHNFFSPNNSEVASVYDGYWGVMGSNYCKNLAYDTCKLTRFDAHCGTYNATIRNSDVGTLTLIGGGKFTIENTNVYTNTASNLITLRSDYGSTWNGEFVIKDVTAISRNKSLGTMALIGAAYTNHNFGYDCYMPKRVTVDGFRVVGASVTKVVLANGSLATAEGVSTATVGGAANLNPFVLTESLVVKNNTAGYTYSLPTTSDFAKTKIIYE